MTLLEAAKQAVEALKMMGYPMSPEAWRNSGDDAPTKAAVEIRALHRAAVALAEAVEAKEGGK